MNMLILYDIAFLVFSLFYLPYFLLKGKFHRDIWQRFGFFNQTINYELSTIDYPIWLHAVSVGEVATLKVFWKKLRQEFPAKRIIISTVTKTGNELAKRFADKNELVFYLPLDISFVINRILRKIKPSVLIIAETEIWPNLINACYKKGIPIILVNGRISNRAFPRYRLVKVVLKRILKKINFICTRSNEDRKRFISLGAPSGDVKVAGNMKYDVKDAVAKQSNLRLKLGLRGKEKIFVAGSTHKGEEEIILEVFKKLIKDFKNLYLIIAPRHIERAAEVKGLAKDLPVTVVDKIGVLQDIYSVSDIVFVGGSLVPHGGHNIIEPAVFGKPILFGPHMFNFQDEANEFLRGGAAIMVKSQEELELNSRRLLGNEKERIELGNNARFVVSKNEGAVENCLYEVKRILAND